MYKCPSCGYVFEEDGKCPMCDIQMEETEKEDRYEGYEKNEE